MAALHHGHATEKEKYTQQQPFYGHYTGQPALAGISG